MRLVTAILLLLVIPTTGAHAAKRIALVVGNNTYQNIPKLERAVNDARAVSSALETLGFQVQLATDLARRDFVRQLATFKERVEPGDIALLYYAGHGIEIRGINYILPVDVPPAKAGQESLLTDEAILTDKVIEDLQERRARATVFVLDACRDNPFQAPGTKSLGGARGLAMGTPPESVFVLYSAGVGQAALDRLSAADPDPNSVFTRIFLRQIRQKDEPMVAVAKSVQVAVRDLSLSVGHTQVPAYYDQIIGQFYLTTGSSLPAKSSNPQPAAVPKQQQTADAAPPPSARPSLNNRAFTEYLGRRTPLGGAAPNWANPNATANCDRLASYGFDVPDSRAQRVPQQSINVKDAVPACIAAVLQDPSTPRLRAQMARALLQSANKTDKIYGIDILVDLAKDGYPAAMWRIGIAYYSGNVIKENKPVAASWFREAADKGLGVAMTDLAILYQNGDGVSKDIKEAAGWFERAAATGDPTGMRNYALVLDLGEAVPRNPKQSAEYLLTAYRMGSDSAQKSLFEFHSSWHADTKSQVQEMLKDFGFYDGRTDGEFDADTFAALKALRSSNPISVNRAR